jgi:hypothetical protein
VIAAPYLLGTLADHLGLHAAFTVEPVLIGAAALLLLAGLRLSQPARLSLASAGYFFSWPQMRCNLRRGTGADLPSGPGVLPGPRGTKLDLVRYYLSVGDGIVRALRERPCMMRRFPSGVAGEKVHQKRVPHGAPPWLETVRVDFPRYGRPADELCVTELASVVWAVQMSTVEFHPWNSRRADVERPDEWHIERRAPDHVTTTWWRKDRDPAMLFVDYNQNAYPLHTLLEWAERDGLD